MTAGTSARAGTEPEPEPEPELLLRVRAGDDHAFAALVDPLREQLRGHCYRMLGSAADAEDAVQEALIRAWRGLSGFEGRSSVRSWLFAVASRTCLDALDGRRRRALPVDLGPAASEVDLGPASTDVRWLTPLPTRPDLAAEEREAVELAFVAALQHLPPNQRAALLLTDVLAFSAAECADALGTSVAAVTSAVQRARGTLAARAPERAGARAADDGAVAGKVRAFAAALQDGDADRLVALLAADVTWSMPPLPAWYAGRDVVMAFARQVPLGGCGDWQHRTTTVNGTVALALYLRPLVDPPADGSFPAWSVTVLDLDPDGAITTITSFLGAEHVVATGLPERLPPR